MKILAIDPSMNATGLVLFDTVKSKIIRVETLEMPKMHKKRKGKPITDVDTRKRRFVLNGMLSFFMAADVIHSEHPHGSQSSEAAKTLGMCIGLVDGLAAGLDKDVFFHTQAASKKNFINSVSDDPELMLSVAVQKYGSHWCGVELMKSKVRWEAVVDAIAILDLALKTVHKRDHDRLMEKLKLSE